MTSLCSAVLPLYGNPQSEPLAHPLSTYRPQYFGSYLVTGYGYRVSLRGSCRLTGQTAHTHIALEPLGLTWTSYTRVIIDNTQLARLAERHFIHVEFYIVI